MSVSLMPIPKQAFFYVDNSGRQVPLVGGKVYTYLAGTSTPAATYTSSTGATANAWPVILDARGEASVWLTPGLYKIVLKDANDVEIYTQDGVSGTGLYAVFDDIAELRSNVGTYDGQVASVAGYYAAADGGGGFFRWNAASSATEDNGLVIKATASATGRWFRLYDAPVNVRMFGAVCDGSTDDTDAIQDALDSVAWVEIPPGATCITSGNTIGSNQTLVVNGTLKLKASSPTGTKMLANDDQVGGNTNIKIIGSGTLDGNKANQSGTTDAVWHTLVDIDNCDYFEFAVAKVTGNYFPTATPSDKTTAAVYVRYSDYVKVHDSIGTDYGRECFWCLSCNQSAMYNLTGYGGTDSWSVVQFSGSRNRADGITAYNAGASGASFDIQNSTVSNVVNYNNNFQNGVNFGHNSKPASGTTAKNIVSIGAAIGSSNSGIQVAADTVDFVLDGFRVEDAAGNGIRISDGSDNVRLCNGTVTGSGGYGLVLFTTQTTNYPRFYVSNVDLRGNTSGGYSRSTGEVQEQFQQVRLSDDPFKDAESVAALGAGGTVTITNGNVRETSTIVMSPSNLAGANAGPLVQTVNDGSFVIQTVNNGAAGAFVRYYIV